MKKLILMAIVVLFLSVNLSAIPCKTVNDCVGITMPTIESIDDCPTAA